ncbi:hypothetical protein B0H16DRAFT_1628041 [Mycena metata]|uniref:Uncharacterized protein n=1 Tax=Mycena metata TaxID=1033252 RepID=A0AAD7H490_9AGAR|nr:hypothetical protein B0H16DRAFT_1628041 [Mycena metata]
MNFARTSLRVLPRVAGFPARRQLHTTPVALAKKKKGKAVHDDFFDDEEQWGVVEDLIPSAPLPKAPPKPTPIVASTSTAPTTPAIPKKARLSPGERRHRFETLIQFVQPRIGRHPTKKTPLVRRTVFPQLINLTTTPEQLRAVTELMVPWKEGRLGTQGKARFGPDGQPKGAFPFAEATSELFARRCGELGIPEHALQVFGAFATYALPLTLPAARRLLHSLIAAGRPLADIVTATALYAPHALPPVHDDLPSCALLLSACLRELKTPGPTEEGGDAVLTEKQRKETQDLVDALVLALQQRLAVAAPMPESKDVRDKTVRRWLKGVMLDVREFLRGKGQERAWLEAWMVRSRFIASAN